MQGRNTLIALLVATAVFLLWMHVVGPRFFPPGPEQPVETQPDEPSGPSPVTTQPRPTDPLTTQPDGPETTTQPGIIAPPAAPIFVLPPTTTQPTDAELTLGALAEPFRMQVILTPRGAGIQQARLTDYYASPDREQHFQIIAEPGEGEPAAMATNWIEVAGQRVDMSNIIWSLAPPPAEADGAQSVRFLASLMRDDQPIVDVYKTFTVSPDDHELLVSYSLVNRTGQPLADVAVGGIGARTLTQEAVKEDRSLAWYARGAGIQRIGRPQVVADPQRVQIPGTEQGLQWAATENRFFVAVHRPVKHPAALTFVGHRLGQDQERSPVVFQWSSERFSLSADEPSQLSLANYLGPKSRAAFAGKRVYLELNYEGLIDVGGTCPCSAWCGTGWLAPAMVWLLRAFYAVVRNYGIAIILLVALVRILLHPLTKKSQISMSKMSKLQPKIEEIKKKYAKDPGEMNKAMAEFYRQEGFSPFLGCLPMLLQMPIWIALWAGLNTAIELRHAPFFWWIRDLAAPDALYKWATPETATALPIPFIGDMLGPLYAFNLLPILLMIAMFGQQLLTPRPAGPQAGQQKFMMYFMTIFFGLLFYNMPSGLTLYVMVSTAVGVGEQYVIRKHIREQEEAEKRGELPRKKESRFVNVRRKRR